MGLPLDFDLDLVSEWLLEFVFELPLGWLGLPLGRLGLALGWLGLLLESLLVLLLGSELGNWLNVRLGCELELFFGLDLLGSSWLALVGWVAWEGSLVTCEGTLGVKVGPLGVTSSLGNKYSCFDSSKSFFIHESTVWLIS